jgi:ribosomal protection tetracycline resistance protein
VSQKELNLGILAHVDAGKTTLTERLLYLAGVIDEVGSVDAGTTQTDTLELERRRGITIKSAVASFAVGEVHVNLIDTPGHPDFIAEVERVLSVLDGAVLVLSAVEGVQSQTRILMRALRRLRIPTLIFVNKIDRAGADAERVLQAIAERLTASVVAMGAVREPGVRSAAFVPHDAREAAFRARLAEVLAEHDEGILAAFVEDEGGIPERRLREQLAAQTSRAVLHPVFFGSAITGAGVEPLLAGIAELLPSAEGDPDGPVSGTVFKIERDPDGRRIAFVRMVSGTIRVRDVVRFGRDREGKVTALSVFEHGPAVQRPSVSAGGVARMSGLAEIQVGDRIGETGTDGAHQFPPPTLETVVAPASPGDGARLRDALAQLAEQDPLIDVRRDRSAGVLSVSLYGEVQKEVIEATLADDYGLEVTFHETTPIYVERLTGPGEAAEILGAESNPYRATIGLHVDPAPAGSGVDFRQLARATTIPLHIYKTAGSFEESMGRYVRTALREGLFGWQVTDCVVTMTECAYSVADGPPSRRGAESTAADFRKLTPLVLRRALEDAGTVVCEPIVRARLEFPADAIGAVLPALARLSAAADTPSLQGSLAVVEAVVPVARVQELQRRLPGLTHGEGVLESSFDGYEPVSGEPPVRRRPVAGE